jgi:hypothetical protein
LDTAIGSHKNYLRLVADFLTGRFAADFFERAGALIAARVRLLSTEIGADLLIVPSSLIALLTTSLILLKRAKAESNRSRDCAIALSAADSA